MTDTPAQLAAKAMAVRPAEFEAVLAWVIAESGLPRADILSQSRTEPLTTWRQIAMVRCCELGMSRPEVGRYFGRDQSSVTHAVRAVERMAGMTPNGPNPVTIPPQSGNMVTGNEGER